MTRDVAERPNAELKRPLHTAPEVAKMAGSDRFGVPRARVCPHAPTGASGVAGLAPSRQIAMTAAMIAGPTNNPIRPKVSKPPKLPSRTHRKGRRVDAPISAGRTK